MPDFKNISSIKVEDDATWRSSIFLTFDIDWAHDDVLFETVELVESAGVAATWFVTHKTKILEYMRQNPEFELGIHPNFNYLLEGDFRKGSSSMEVISRIKSIVPEATSVRSHSLTQSSIILDNFKKTGLTHDVNCIIPNDVGITLKPWHLCNGMQRIPYAWEDDVHLSYENLGKPQMNPANCLIMEEGLKVFDFHPIHVFLNTESIERYERTRHLHQMPRELIEYRFKGYGTRNRLFELMELAGK
jgi:hypothetical protein